MNLSNQRFYLLGVLVLAVATLLGTGLWLTIGPHPRFGAGDGARPDSLQQYGAVPDFLLTERSGDSIGLNQLRGKIWIADFIYTSCTDTCPLQTGMMARLQDEYAGEPGLQLVSITVDPERDTPQSLARYAARYKADAKRWFFLTGQRDRIVRLIQNGFHLSVASLPADADQGAVIPHSPRFVLVDREARIRGYYDSRDLAAFVRLKNDLETLLKG